MSCASILQSMPVDMAFVLHRSSPPRNRRLALASPKPLRPCIHHRAFLNKLPPSTNHAPAKTVTRGTSVEKRVIFADSKGLSLTSVRVFCKREEKAHLEPLEVPKPQTLHLVNADTVQGTKMRLGFTQPCEDFQAFCGRLRESAVLLESCCATERSILGTVRVRNISYEKTVHVRVTFDSWRTYRDVPCAYLDQRYGDPDTDVFAFNIVVPGSVDPREQIEFCVSYLPGGFSSAVWDNNYGKNYSIHMCV
ncbi:protein phosphatase 1 regulatory subunit 3C [Electrophorus electricus]|uniref:Protein phosphatase 1 regulatory subunit n=1 Tax=Electrophorus electricus TaxID=8005 RepID=A0A4W4FNS5_ELEEL|nr:protein phosphatase 1 regulatory subunit 3C [Electrophorus electricus]